MLKVRVVMNFWSVYEFETDKSMEYMIEWANKMLESSRVDRIEVEDNGHEYVFVPED